MNSKSSPARANYTAILIVSCLALATVVAAMASLNVALPSIARDTHASQTKLEWIIDAYSLIFASLLLPSGAIGDKFGRRRALIIGLAIFGAGSLAATTVHSANVLIALRGVLGLGASLVMPATLSTITGTFPIERRSRAIAIWAGVAGGAAIAGLLTSGCLLEAFSWQSVFWLNVVLAGTALVGVLRIVPESADRDAPPLDLVGAVVAVVGLVSIVYSVIEAPDRGWASVSTLSGLGLGLVVLAGFVTWELRCAHPLLDPRVFRHRQFTAGTTSIFVQFFGFFGFVFTALQYLQIVRGDSALIGAVSVLPMGATMVPISRITPKLVDRFGSRRVCASGLLIISAAMVILSRVDAGSSYWLILAGLVPLGAGMGMAMTPATTAITSALPASQQGVGSAMNDLARELGGALGIAVLGSVLAASYRSHLHLVGVPTSVAGQARSSIAVAQHIGGPVALAAHGAFMTGMHAALLCAAIVLAVAAGVVVAMLRTESPESITLPEQTGSASDRTVVAAR